MDNPIKMDDLGGNPLFSETSTYCLMAVTFICSLISYFDYNMTFTWKNNG